MPIAQVQSSPDAPDAASPEVNPPVPRQRDLREQLMPADPLGLRPGTGSISGLPALSEDGCLAVIATTGVESGPSAQERHQAQRYELAGVALVITALLLTALWFYLRRGQENLAGHDNR